MKKTYKVLMIIIIILICNCSLVYANDNTIKDSESEDDSYVGTGWISKAFEEARKFLKGEEDEDYDPTFDDQTGLVNVFLDAFKRGIKVVNVVLLVALFGISTIALSVVGIRFIITGAIPTQREQAQRDLHTIFFGMLYGFGAYTIWTVSMKLLELIISAMAVTE